VPEIVDDHSRVVNNVLAPPAGVYKLDPVHTFVTFSVQHLIIGRVRGRFDAVEGTITVGEDPLVTAVEVSVETRSVNTMTAARDDDLRSERFLDVAKYPTMTYRSAGVTAVPGGAWLVKGDLTLRGVTRPVELLARFEGSLTDPYGNARVAFHARGSITRTDFGLTTELLKEAGGLLVGKDIILEIDAEAIRPL
jgi:polyisoprenoid-binding protein YceI